MLELVALILFAVVILAMVAAPAPRAGMVTSELKAEPSPSRPISQTA